MEITEENHVKKWAKIVEAEDHIFTCTIQYKKRFFSVYDKVSFIMRKQYFLTHASKNEKMFFFNFPVY